MMNERKRNRGAGWWRIWLDEINSARPDMARAIDAAKHLAAQSVSATQLRQWLAAIASDLDDPLTCEQSQAQLPDFIAAQTNGVADAASDKGDFAELRTHLALCPFCMEAYAQTAEWVAASVVDTVPVSNSYPAFDLSFLKATPAPASPTITERVQEAVAVGQRWLDDVAGGVYLLFGPSLQNQPAVAWAVKSGEPGALLAQMVLAEEELDGWEITVAAFAQEGSGGLCQLEVALYRPDAELEGIKVRLSFGQEERMGQTDAGGVVVFTDVPITQLPEVVVHTVLARGQTS